jgi:hypothetical protein
MSAVRTSISTIVEYREVYMKKAYTAPRVTLSGDVVRETKGSGGIAEDPVTGPLQAPGSVGFNL